MARFSRDSGVLLAGFLWLLVIADPAAAQSTSLPSGWTDRDIGFPAIAGSAESSGDTLIVRGAGSDIWDQSDQFHFVYQSITGDADIRVRVADLQDVHTWTKAGVMIREALTEDARHAFMLVTPSQGLAFQWRSQTGRNTAHAGGAAVAAPVWLRLVRAGNVFRAYSSSTGDAWTLVGTATINMQSQAYVGVAVTSHDTGETATAQFSNLTVGSSTTTPPALPAPWIATDVGSPALAGRSNESGGTFTVAGAGEDIWNESDQFQFVYQPVTGDSEIVALVASLQGVDDWSKAGVMIRAGLTGPAAHAFMLASGANGWAFQRRLLTGGSSYHTAGSGGAAPGWVRLVRLGDVFSAYQSPDGTQWSLVGSETIPMPATVDVGLAVTSHNPGALATATFSNVSLRTPIHTNQPPTVAITSPAPNATFVAPATIVINAAAADVDGSVTRVDFFQNSQSVGSVSTSPFAATSSNVPAGSYNLSAVATDNEGATATSTPVLVRVGFNPTLPIAIVFAPSPDNDIVSSYTVELRREGDAPTASPVASKNVGKPAVANGVMSADITSTVNALPTGSYYAVVVAAGVGGSTPSNQSPVFWK